MEIRSIEEKGALKQQTKKMLIEKINKTKYLDSSQAMRYINNTFRDTYKSKYGGLNYFIHREEERNKDTEILFTTVSQATLIGLGSGLLILLVTTSIMVLSFVAAQRLVKSAPSTFKIGMRSILARFGAF